MHQLPHNLYRPEQVRELDRIAIEEYGIPARELMERAGAAAFGVLQWRWPDARRIAVVCGVGNNGGDGYVLARLARAAGLSVDVYRLGEGEQLRGAAAQAAEALHDCGLTPVAYTGQSLYGYEIIIDAIFGTGLDREVTGSARDAINAVNSGGASVLVLDVPSGLDADTGRILGVAVRGDVTVAFVGLKRGQFTASGPDCCGSIHYSSLDLPGEIFSRLRPAVLRFDLETLNSLLVPRLRDSNKGDYGHVLVVGGGPGMMGAALLAAEAAGRSGAGRVSVATHSGHAPLISARRPEVMSHGVEDVSDLRGLIARASVIAIGPGLGRSSWAQHLLGYALETSLPMVVDADALNLLSVDPARRDNWVITPHPGEAGRLLGMMPAEIQQDRFYAVAELQRRYGGVAVLKGAGTLIGSADQVLGLCDAGNPGMASGGMGDVLTGIIAALIGQGISLADAACLGCLLHAEAGDRAAAVSGQRGLLAGDLIARLHKLVNPY